MSEVVGVSIKLKGAGRIHVPDGFGTRADYRGTPPGYRGRPLSFRVEDESGRVLAVIPEEVMQFVQGSVELEPLEAVDDE